MDEMKKNPMHIVIYVISILTNSPNTRYLEIKDQGTCTLEA